MISSRKTLVLLTATSLLLLLLMTSHPKAQQAICKVYWYITDETDARWLLFDGGNPFFSGGSSVDYYVYKGSLGCIDVGGKVSPPGGGWVYALSEAAALELCEANLNNVAGVSLDPKSSYDYIYICHLEKGTSASDGHRQTSSSRPDLPLTGLRINAFDGAGSGIQFKRLDNYGIGDQSVIDMGFLDAVDVFFNIGSGYEVCFPQIGRIVFLDAATSPRTVAFPEYRHDDGWTCASMDRAGTMVLVNAPEGTATQTSTATQSETATRRPGTYDDFSTAVPLEDCLVTPRVNLRLRSAPWGRILDVVPSGIEITAEARTKSWFYLAYLNQVGWIASWLTTDQLECDWSSGQSNISAKRYQIGSD